jgi:hypothetical protein
MKIHGNAAKRGRRSLVDANPQSCRPILTYAAAQRPCESGPDDGFRQFQGINSWQMLELAKEIEMLVPRRIIPALFLLSFAIGPLVLAADPANSLSDEEKKAGWKLLFDGKTTAGWRGYNMKEMPKGWKVIDGALIRVSGGAGGKGAGGGDDIITLEEFADFELSLEWKIVAGGNSGVLYRVVEGAVTSWHVAPEMQVLDDSKWPKRDKRQLAGSLYDLYAPAKAAAKSSGDWNVAKVIANGKHVEHWLNGEKLLEYELNSDDWKERVAASKFRKLADFAKAMKGHICLQDHSDRVEYRNIKIRPLKSKP